VSSQSCWRPFLALRARRRTAKRYLTDQSALIATSAEVSFTGDSPILLLQERALNQTPRGIVQLRVQTRRNANHIGDDKAQTVSARTAQGTGKTSIMCRLPLSLGLDNHNGEEGEDRSYAALAYGETIEAQLTGTELNHIVHGNRDRRAQRTPKLLLPNPR
jgi:hypothetical protein